MYIQVVKNVHITRDDEEDADKKDGEGEGDGVGPTPVLPCIKYVIYLDAMQN